MDEPSYPKLMCTSKWQWTGRLAGLTVTCNTMPTRLLPITCASLIPILLFEHSCGLRRAGDYHYGGRSTTYCGSQSRSFFPFTCVIKDSLMGTQVLCLL